MMGAGALTMLKPVRRYRSRLPPSSSPAVAVLTLAGLENVGRLAPLPAVTALLGSPEGWGGWFITIGGTSDQS
jgi:hypothetical protein